MKSASLRLHLRTSPLMNRLHLSAVVPSSGISIQSFTGMDGGPAAQQEGPPVMTYCLRTLTNAGRGSEMQPYD